MHRPAPTSVGRSPDRPEGASPHDLHGLRFDPLFPDRRVHSSLEQVSASLSVPLHATGPQIGDLHTRPLIVSDSWPVHLAHRGENEATTALVRLAAHIGATHAPPRRFPRIRRTELGILPYPSEERFGLMTVPAHGRDTCTLLFFSDLSCLLVRPVPMAVDVTSSSPSRPAAEPGGEPHCAPDRECDDILEVLPISLHLARCPFRSAFPRDELAASEYTLDVFWFVRQADNHLHLCVKKPGGNGRFFPVAAGIGGLVDEPGRPEEHIREMLDRMRSEAGAWWAHGLRLPLFRYVAGSFQAPRGTVTLDGTAADCGFPPFLPHQSHPGEAFDTLHGAAGRICAFMLTKAGIQGGLPVTIHPIRDPDRPEDAIVLEHGFDAIALETDFAEVSRFRRIVAHMLLGSVSTPSWSEMSRWAMARNISWLKLGKNSDLADTDILASVRATAGDATGFSCHEVLALEGHYLRALLRIDATSTTTCHDPTPGSAFEGNP